MVKGLLLRLIELYQHFISPFLALHFNLHCRYYPSCSEYAKLAIKDWGILRGSLLALKRFLRCHPLSPGGIDFPPPKDLHRRINNHG
uniref:Putative membrane protein insertion efficiency factor n=1 Tax=Caldimicrobium thiodismutans TaxID=1653476 RepID=A0A832GMR2_9BACT